ncbi:MAG: prenyltransferase [Thiogranum sp.]|nr:prenyltransferase [Thiogranum sp.]
MQLKTILRTTRPAFLVLAPVCVLLGLACALTAQSTVSVSLLVVILLGALLAHVSVNTLNEYHDFTSGLDLKTRKTAFSGGSGALPGHPHVVRAVLFVGLLSLALTAGIGLYLLSQRTPQLLPLGLTGLVLIATYTRWLNRWPLVCLVAPGLGFGVLMVVGTQVVLTGTYAPLSWLVSLVPFFLVNNLLLLNQYPDIEADASVGRRHFPIVFGVRASNIVYAVFALAAYAVVLYLAVDGYISRLGLIALIPLVFSLFTLTGAVKHMSRIGEHAQYLAANVAAAILTPMLLALAMLYG